MSHLTEATNQLKFTLLLVVIIVQTFLVCLSSQNNGHRWRKADLLFDTKRELPEEHKDDNNYEFNDQMENYDGFPKASHQIDAFNPAKCGRANFPHNWMKKLNSYTCLNADQQPMSKTNESVRIGMRIAGGYQPKLGDFPSVVQVVYLAGLDQSLCSGVLIHNDLVLTAGHCVEGPASKAMVFAGSVSLFNADDRGLSLKVAGQCVAENYVPGDDLENDWAVLRLARPVRYTRAIQPVCLDFRRAPNRNVACVTAGFGLTDFDELSMKLRAAVMSRCRRPGAPDTTCWEQIRPSPWSGNTCKGDSGSPMYCFDGCSQSRPTMHLVGLLSTGTNDRCAKYEKDYSFFTDIHKQAKRKRMQELFLGCIDKLRKDWRQQIEVYE